MLKTLFITIYIYRTNFYRIFTFLLQLGRLSMIAYVNMCELVNRYYKLRPKLGLSVVQQRLKRQNEQSMRKYRALNVTKESGIRETQYFSVCQSERSSYDGYKLTFLAPPAPPCKNLKQQSRIVHVEISPKELFFCMIASALIQLSCAQVFTRIS